MLRITGKHTQSSEVMPLLLNPLSTGSPALVLSSLVLGVHPDIPAPFLQEGITGTSAVRAV